MLAGPAMLCPRELHDKMVIGGSLYIQGIIDLETSGVTIQEVAMMMVNETTVEIKLHGNPLPVCIVDIRQYEDSTRMVCLTATIDDRYCYHDGECVPDEISLWEWTGQDYDGEDWPGEQYEGLYPAG